MSNFSRTWSRGDARNNSHAAHACVCFLHRYTNISCHRTALFYRLGVEISMRFTLFCGRKKELLINLRPAFCESLLEKKLLIKTEKVNYSLRCRSLCRAKRTDEVRSNVLSCHFFCRFSGNRLDVIAGTRRVLRALQVICLSLWRSKALALERSIMTKMKLKTEY